MFFDLALALICCICFLISARLALFSRSKLQRVASMLFCVAFAIIIIAMAIIGVSTKDSKEDLSPAEDYDSVTTAILSYYVPLGATESGDYYLEITEDDKYKFCYFEPDGITIDRVQIPAHEKGVEIIASNDDLPYRVDFCAKADKVVAVKIHIPDDANAIQFDADGK